MTNPRFPMIIPKRLNAIAPPAAESRVKQFKLPILLTLVHIPFGILLYRAGAIAVLHPLGVFFLGMYWAFQKNEKLEKTALVVTTSSALKCCGEWQICRCFGNSVNMRRR